jgi:hypothetical protein
MPASSLACLRVLLLHVVLAPVQAPVTFDFEAGLETGWTTSPGTYNCPRCIFSHRSGSTPSYNTGPSSGYGGSGYYYYAEASNAASGNAFILEYNGSACASRGELVTTIVFQYHMYGSTMGTLELVAPRSPAREILWSLSGNQGNAWTGALVNVNDASFRFSYTRGSSVRDRRSNSGLRVPEHPRRCNVFVFRSSVRAVLW